MTYLYLVPFYVTIVLLCNHVVWSSYSYKAIPLFLEIEVSSNSDEKGRFAPLPYMQAACNSRVMIGACARAPLQASFNNGQ